MINIEILEKAFLDYYTSYIVKNPSTAIIDKITDKLMNRVLDNGLLSEKGADKIIELLDNSEELGNNGRYRYMNDIVILHRYMRLYGITEDDLKKLVDGDINVNKEVTDTLFPDEIIKDYVKIDEDLLDITLPVSLYLFLKRRIETL